MSTWNNATMTVSGNNLQAKLVEGDTLVFTRVVAGTGTVPAAQLANQTAVSNIAGTLTIQEKRYTGGGTVVIPVLLTNEGVTTSYTAKQIGFYATDPDEGEILYCIAQDTTGEVIPAAADSPGQTVEWQFTINYGNASSVSATVEMASIVTYSGGDNRYAQKSHASADTTYGVGTTSDYGHVKVTNGNGLSINGGTVSMAVASQSTTGAMSNGDKTKLDGVAVNANNYSHPNSGATAGTYRSVTVNEQGHVTGGTNPTMAVNQGGTGATDAATARTNLGTAPISHASNASTYGTGTASNYGHVRLSNSTTSTSGEDGGIAATPAAVKAAVDAAATASAGKAPTNHASTVTTYGVGSTTNYGHVKVTNGNGLTVTNGTVAMAAASQSANGAMIATDKTKLDGVETGANNYTHPNSGITAGTYRSVTVNSQGHATAGTNPTTTVAEGGTGATTAAEARTNLGVPPTSHASTGTTYGVGSTSNYGHVKVTNGNGLTITNGTVAMAASTDSAAGAMTSEDHQKLTALDSIIIGKVTTEETTDARLEIYVSPSGNDSNDGKSLGAQMKTLRAVLKKYGGQNRLIIHMADGTYTDSEALQISGGYVNIDSQSNDASRVQIKFPITFFDSRVYLNYITIDTSAFYTSAAVNLGTLMLRHSQFALTNCVIKGLTANIYGVFARFASVGYILNTTITHSSTGLMADAGAVVTLLNSTIASTVTNGINANNSFISASGGTNSATTPQRKSGTGVIFNGGNISGTTTNSLATATI